MNDDVKECRLFLATAAGIAAHQVQSFVVEPEQRSLRALALLGLAVGATAFSRALGPALRGRRGSIALAVGAGPTFGAIVGHVVPLLRRGSIEPVSETATLNLGCGGSMLALGTSLLTHRAPE